MWAVTGTAARNRDYSLSFGFCEIFFPKGPQCGYNHCFARHASRAPAANHRIVMSTPAKPFATSPSSPTSTMARRRWSTSCWCRPGTFAKHQHVGERMMDSNDLERERGITILAKNCSIRLPRHADQHRRHAGPRRLRRRGRARAGHGRRRAAAGRRRRRPDAADALRHAEGAVAGPAADRRRQQGRPARRAARMGRQPDLRAVRQARRHRRAARFPGRLRVGAERLGDDRRRMSPRGRSTPEGGDMRALFETILAYVPAPVGDPDEPLQFQVSALDYSSYVGRLGIGRIRRGRMQAGAGSRDPQRSACGGRNSAEGEDRPGIRVRGHGARAGRLRAGGRHRARHRHRRPHDRHDAGVDGDARAAAADLGRPAHAVDVLPGQHVAARRARRQVRDVAQPARPARQGSADQRRAARRGDGRHRCRSSCLGAASCISRS